MNRRALGQAGNEGSRISKVAGSGLLTRASVRVRFSDTDAMGIVHHARCFDYFEAAREAYMRRRLIDFGEVFASGHNLPLVGAEIRFQRPLRFGDLLTVEIRLVDLTRVRLRFEYRIIASPDVVDRASASGWTEHVFTDNQLNLRRFPRELMESLLRPERCSGEE